PEADTSHPTTSSIPLPSLPTASIPPVTQTVTTPIRQYSRRARIAQSSALPTIADEPASPVRDVNKGMQQTISELMALCTSLQRQHSELLAKFQAQEVEILRLKDRVQVLEDRERVAAKQSGDDAPIKRRSINEGEVAAERISNDSKEIARVWTSMDAATVLAGGIDVPTGSGSIPTVGPPATDISTGSEVAPTASLIVTSYSRRKGKEVMVDSNTPKKQRLQERIDAQVARELEEQQEKEDMRMNEQIARDAESQQRRTMTKKQKRDYYIAMIRNNLGWKVKDFKAERLKRKGLNLEQEHVKKQKTSEVDLEIEKSTEEISKEKMKEMMQLIRVWNFYVLGLLGGVGFKEKKYDHLFMFLSLHKMWIKCRTNKLNKCSSTRFVSVCEMLLLILKLWLRIHWMKHQTNVVAAVTRNSLTEAYKKLKAVAAATATDTPDEHTQILKETYDIYLLPAGADSKTCESYLRIRNRKGRYILMFESSRNLTDDQVKSVMLDEHTQTLEDTYDIYLLPPGADSETCESYLRIRRIFL
nr:uridine-cytidine kinase C-like [Tanacetum cinerariifolium]